MSLNALFIALTLWGWLIFATNSIANANLPLLIQSFAQVELSLFFTVQTSSLTSLLFALHKYEPAFKELLPSRCSCSGHYIAWNWSPERPALCSLYGLASPLFPCLCAVCFWWKDLRRLSMQTAVRGPGWGVVGFRPRWLNGDLENHLFKIKSLILCGSLVVTTVISN